MHLRERKTRKFCLVTPFSSKQNRWFSLKCINIHTGKQDNMVDPAKEKNPPYNVVFPSQFARLLIEYQEHPESESLAPDGSRCKPHTSGLLQRAHIVAGEFRYVGKETDRKWEEGDDISVLEFKSTGYIERRKPHSGKPVFQAGLSGDSQLWRQVVEGAPSIITYSPDCSRCKYTLRFSNRALRRSPCERSKAE